MFTGLVKSLGTVEQIDGGQIEVSGANFLYTIGDSIAINGVCLTVSSLMEGGFGADVSPETWQRTNLSYLRVGHQVNLEPALAVGDRLGGHFVSGHVDGLGKLRSSSLQGNSWWMDFEIPDRLQRYVVEKGSVAVNGISLTIASCNDGFQVAIIPHTFSATNLQYTTPDIPVNLEMDILAKYVENLIQTQNKITPDFLTEHGYI